MIFHQFSRLFAQVAKTASRRRAVHKMLTEQQIKVTPRAADRLKEVVDEGERLRLEVDGGGCSGFEYKIRLDKRLNDDDLVWRTEQGAEIVVDELSLGYMQGATVDFVEDLMKASFRIVNNPVAEKGCSCGSSFALKLD
uniref:Fe-S_biosyn domain-containing protein n=2 Tax=Caenorhabditis japonica TaxID=281687 RepID=A0A8R1I1Q7_CAEJA